MSALSPRVELCLLFAWKQSDGDRTMERPTERLVRNQILLFKIVHVISSLQGLHQISASAHGTNKAVLITCHFNPVCVLM